MRSLLYKDLMNLKQQLRFYVILFVFYIFISLKQGSANVMGVVLAVLAITLSVTAYAYDERAGWDKYALTMPFRARDLILSKYLLALIGIGVTIAVILPLNIMVGTNIREALMMAGVWVAFGLFYIEIILPVIFRFGVEKGRILMIVIFLLPTMLLLLFEGRTQAIDPKVFERALMLAPIVLLLLLPVSVAISYKVYKKQEF